MKKNIIKVIGTLTFLTLMFFNVQFIFSGDNNNEKVNLKFIQSEANAIMGWKMENYDWGCRCEINSPMACIINFQCLCSWTYCSCCQQSPE